MKKKIIAVLLASCLLAGCSKAPANTENAQSGESTATEESSGAEGEENVDDEESSEGEEAEASGEMTVGEVYHGFKLDDVYSSSLLSSDMYTFTHEKSGAMLLYTKNSDPECAFSIAYRTPYVDETDTNHVFEHAIIASSKKYPSKDIFFDIANKSYSSFVNAFTSFNNTMYPVSSYSQDQLMKLMDVYMSCMVEPGILDDENFFKREAVRYELADPESDITINGTVFAEDTGYLTDQKDRALDNTLDKMYPGEIAANMIGKANYNYADLTYEHTLETFERCYHFDNSLICLYGDLDIDRFLEFLDTEYLSKYEVNGTDLSQYEDPLTEEGYVEEVMDMPAYEGDTVENNGVIYYAIDMQQADYVELVQWEVLASILNSSSSCLGKKLVEDGIQNPVSVGVETDLAKPLLIFSMQYANADQMQTLKDIAQYTLEEVAKNGVSKELFDANVKEEELNTVFLRDATNVGVNLASTIGSYWSTTGKTDLFKQYEDVYAALKEDAEQTIFKTIAEKACTPRRSVLIANIPKPGLAEEHDAELQEYLKNMKENMTDEEVEALVKETQEFNEWNATEIANSDFLIDLAELPDYESTKFEKTTEDGITYYLGDVDVEGAGSYELLFDLSGMSKDELLALRAYLSVLLETKTSKYSTEELDILESEYLMGFSTSLMYPGEASGDNHRPILAVTWKGLTGDFEKSLDLLMNVLTETDLTDTGNISYVISRDSESYDLSRAGGFNVAGIFALAAGTGAEADASRFQLDCEGQDLYHYMSDAAASFAGDENAAEAYAEEFENARTKAFSKTNLIFVTCANPEENKTVKDVAAGVFANLQEKAESDSTYELPVIALKTGVIVEESQNNTYMVANYNDSENFRGAYIPYIYAANDKYTVPQIRFQLGAYSAGSYVRTRTGEIMSYTYSDPNVKNSIDVLTALPEYVKTAELTEDDFKGYALTAYSDATSGTGIWSDSLRAVNRDILGIDEASYIEAVNDIKNADLSMQAEAAESIEKAFENASYATAGNDASITADKDVFDEIVNYKEK